MSRPIQARLEAALAAGRPIHVIAGLGVDDLAAVGLTSLDAPLAALSWLRLEPGVSGGFELAHRALSLRLDPAQGELARGRLSFIAERPSGRLIDLAGRGPIVGHALESTLLARIDRATAGAIAGALVDLVDLVGELGAPTERGDRSLARLLGREPAFPADALERAEVFARYWQPARDGVSGERIDALLVDDRSLSAISIGRRPLDELVEGTPERLSLAGGLAMVCAAERLGSDTPASGAIDLLRALGGAPELAPAGRVLIVDRDGGALVRESHERIRELLSLPRGG